MGVITFICILPLVLEVENGSYSGVQPTMVIDRLPVTDSFRDKNKVDFESHYIIIPHVFSRRDWWSSCSTVMDRSDRLTS